MKIPQTIEMQVGALNASEHNPRQITEDDFAELVKSLLLLPKGLYYRPVVVDDRNIALAGNMRLRALKYIHELGFDDLAEILRDRKSTRLNSSHSSQSRMPSSA